MENESAPPDSPKQNTTSPAARDPLIRYSVFAALGCAGVCMIFTILYVFSYSLDSTLSFERHFDSYLASANSGNLSTVLGLHMAQNRMFLQSCGMVGGIFFAFLGLALFLVGIQGTTDATGEIRDYSTSVKRLAPGGIILLASMIFVGVSAMHPIDLQLSPVGTPSVAAPTAAVEPAPQPAAPAVAQPAATQPAATQQPATQSQTQPAPQPTTQTAPTQQQPTTTTTAHLTPQSAPISTTQQTLQRPVLQQPPTQQSTPQPATTPAQTPAQRPVTRPVLVPVNQSAAVSPNRVPPLHHFQP